LYETTVSQIVDLSRQPNPRPRKAARRNKTIDPTLTPRDRAGLIFVSRQRPCLKLNVRGSAPSRAQKETRRGRHRSAERETGVS